VNSSIKPLQQYEGPPNGESPLFDVEQEARLLDDLLSLDVSQIDTRRYPGAFSSDGPTPYEMSGLAESYTAEECRNDPHRLHNAKDPYYPLKHEKFAHRNIIFLKAQGLSNVKIAEQLGITAVTVSNVLRQPWAQTQVLEIIHENGGDAVRQLLCDEALRSVERLIVERDNPEARPSERIVAADKLLDRLYGKPNQPIEHRSQNLDTMSDEELERIARQGIAAGSSETATATS